MNQETIESRIQFREFSSLCPQQFEAFYEDRQVAYLHVRHGRFYVCCPDETGVFVYETDDIEGDGCFEDLAEQVDQLEKARTAIAAWIVQTQPRT